MGASERRCESDFRRERGDDVPRSHRNLIVKISETKNSRKQQLALRHLVNRLVPENA
jgi:hypothetical protein